MNIKLIAFDLDGTLIPTKELHYNALNDSLREISPDYVISLDDHLKYFDGLSTKSKLKKLVELGMNPDLQENIYKRKQEITQHLLETYDFKVNHDRLFKYLKSKNFYIAVCSNAIKNSVKSAINILGLTKYIDLVLSNEDVLNPKPDPEIYLKCLSNFNVLPEETLIFEDNDNGIISAEKSNSFVKIITGPEELGIHSVKWAIKSVNNFNFNNKNILKTFCSKDGNIKYKVICPICNDTRMVYVSNIKEKRFTSECNTCSARKQYNPNKKDKSGYRLIPLFVLNESDRLLALQMCNINKFVREHRLVMAKHLNRPLHQYEIVHHINGIKCDNKIENLKLLTLDTHHCGHGDFYYQKWQEAESKIKILEEQLKTKII